MITMGDLRTESAMASKLFIVLEGLDGTGKSTQAKLLNQKLSGELHSTSSLVSKPRTRFERYDAYMGNNTLISEKTLASNTNNRFVVDRYVASTYASFHAEKYIHPPTGVKWNEYYPDCIVVPGIIINIELAEHTRLERINQRSKSTDAFENRLASNLDFRMCMKNWLRAMSTVTIDATNLSIDELHEVILSVILELV
jgi:thymidylate kinase